MLITEVYLIQSMSDILLQQEEDAVADEIDAMKKHLIEELNRVIFVSEYFYFNTELEQIAKKTM